MLRLLGENSLKNLILFIVAFLAASCGSARREVRLIANENNVSNLNHSVVGLILPTNTEIRNMGLSNPYQSRGLNTLGRSHRTYCSGFFVSRRSILTAAHCVRRVSVTNTMFGPRITPLDEDPTGDLHKVISYSQYMASGHNMQVYRLYEVTRYNSDQDVALLTLTDGQTPHSHLNVLKLGGDPHTGEIVYCLGHPANQPWTLTEGIISTGYRTVRRVVLGRSVIQRVTQASSQVFFGNSGGPLINNEGRVVGVASNIIQPHIAFFTHVRVLRSLIAENH